MKITKQQRWFIADKLMDGANLALAGLVIGQFVSETLPNWLTVVLGFIVYIVAWIISVLLRR